MSRFGKGFSPPRLEYLQPFVSLSGGQELTWARAEKQRAKVLTFPGFPTPLRNSISREGGEKREKGKGNQKIWGAERGAAAPAFKRAPKFPLQKFIQCTVSLSPLPAQRKVGKDGRREQRKAARQMLRIAGHILCCRKEELRQGKTDTEGTNYKFI